MKKVNLEQSGITIDETPEENIFGELEKVSGLQNNFSDYIQTEVARKLTNKFDEALKEYLKKNISNLGFTF